MYVYLYVDIHRSTTKGRKRNVRVKKERMNKQQKKICNTNMCFHLLYLHHACSYTKEICEVKRYFNLQTSFGLYC